MLYKFRRLLFAVILVSGYSAGFGQTATTEKLPVDPKVKIGKLANGLTYYIRKNQEPKKRAELRLVIKAGSVLESDAQRGLAHFTEHMAFNGTKHFKKQELVNFLEKSGVNFGADLNAYTSFDETVYELQLPTDSAEVFKKGFQILQDWAYLLSFDDTEIDRERGVIQEERRVRRNAGQRLFYKSLPVILNNSQYAKRIPIGDSLVVSSFKHDVLKKFYADWYRPDLEAVVIVGDFDVAEVEKMVKATFGAIPVKAKVAKPEFGVPASNDVKSVVETDPEQQYNVVQVIFKQGKETPVITEADYRTSLVQDLFNQMINLRMQELTQKPDAPFLYGNSAYTSLIGNIEIYQLTAVAKDGTAINKALEALLTETERVNRFGFTQSEIDRAKKSFLSNAESSYNERNKTNSKGYIDEYVQNFLKGEAIPGIEKEYELDKTLLPGIKLEEVNALIKKWLKPTDRVVVVQAPESEKKNLLPATDYAAILKQNFDNGLTAYEDKVAVGGLMPTPPTPGKIVNETQVADLGVTVWTLSNGARVVVKPTDFKDDEIQFSAISAGGSSLASDDDYVTASNAVDIVQMGGLGQLNINELQKELTGKQANASPSISRYSQGMGGGSTPKDFETALQMMNLYFTAPRKDSAMFNVLKTQFTAIFSNRNKNPQAVLGDTLHYLLGNYNIRSKPFGTAEIPQLNLDKAFSFYQDRFADAGSFVFTFVGNLKLDSLKPLVEKYIASLPATGRKESWKDNGIRFPTGKIERTVYKGKENKASVNLFYTGNAEYSDFAATQLSQLGKILDIKLRESLREDQGGTYGVSVNTGLNRVPVNSYSISISWTCAAENVDKLTTAAMAVISKVKAEGSTAVDVEKVIAEDTRALETAVKQNGYWLANLEDKYYFNEDPLIILKDAETIKKLTVPTSKELANKYLNDANFIKVVLLPEKN